MDLPKTFCIYPWVHTQIDSDGSLLTCCEVPLSERMAKISDGDLEAAWNSQNYRSIRKEILAGEIPNQCHGCFEKEKVGHESDRIKANVWYKDHFKNVEKTQSDGSVDFTCLESLDLRVSNTCNFKCRTCTPAASSALAKEWPFISKKNPPPINRQAFVSSNDALIYLKPALEQIEMLYFAGGEPFLQKEHFEILDYLISIGRASDLSLFYNTNFSMTSFAGKDIFTLLKKFKRVTINMSLDDSHARGEYLRDGLDWPIFLENYKVWKTSLTNCEFFLNITISNMNSFYLPEFLEVCLNELGICEERIILNPVTVPAYYHLANIPSGLKRKILEKLSAYKNRLKNGKLSDGLMAIIEMIKDDCNPKELKVFRMMTNRLDQIRGQSFSKLFPDLREMVDGEEKE